MTGLRVGAGIQLEKEAAARGRQPREHHAISGQRLVGDQVAPDEGPPDIEPRVGVLLIVAPEGNEKLAQVPREAERKLLEGEIALLQL
ncbi:MAG TPA: hypothetical protein PLY56_11395 [Armatimonadota bacterium]|nr:hypothetical protein [Armatimonadota bacterium]